MGRPTSKSELLQVTDAQYRKLIDLVDGLTEEQQQEEFSFEDRDRNCRDVLAHLVEWQRLLIVFVEANQAGDDQPFLPQPYKWNDYSGLNDEFLKRNQSVSFQKVREELTDSHSRVLDLVEEHSNEQLFTKKYYPWTGSTSLGAYCISASSSHYEWAMKKIRKHKRTVQI